MALFAARLAVPSITAAEESGPAAQPVLGSQLAVQQGVLADKYARLEKLLDDMARIEAASNPRRAALLIQALQQSKERLTAVKLNACIQALNQQQMSRALENQRDAQTDIQALLELLLSENRSDRLKRDQDRIREYLKEVERILRLQKSVQGQTEGGSDPQELAEDQGKIAERTADLAQQIRESEQGEAAKPAAEATPGEPREGEQRPAETPPGEPTLGESKPGESKSGEAKQSGERKPGESQREEGSSEKKGSPQGKPSGDRPEGEPQPAEQGAPKPSGDGKPGGHPGGKSRPQQGAESEGQPSPGEPNEGGKEQDQQEQPEQDPSGKQQNPAAQRVQAAEQRMREARQRLEQAQRDEAVAEQERAKEELEKAKAELEKILRQMREEEIERMLAMLEGRFRKMLEGQLRIYEETQRLDKVPEAERELKVPIPAARLATDQRKLAIEADKALNLLLEEGSSVAFPETVEQLRDDMQQSADRLDGAKVNRITQGIQEDVIAALEEMIAALQKAQQELEKQQQQEQQPMPAEPGEMPIVDPLAELKMIRALQVRVNTRTSRYARLLDDMEDPVGQAGEPDLVEALVKLAERQESIYRITRDIVLGKNR